MILLLLALAMPAGGQRAEFPEFVAGDQCLFCHRNDIGPRWQKNAHNLTVQPKEGSDTGFTVGAGVRHRDLRKSGYGKFEIKDRDGTWNPTKFAERCAGCHTTAVNGDSKAFTAYAIDCFACHGAVDLEHSNDTSRILLSKKNRHDAKAITSICGSCHLRGGQSKTKGVPYAYHFVPGDNLFIDYTVNFARAEDRQQNPGDRHVWRNVRDVLENNSDITCLSCHSLHAGNTTRHRRVLTSPACLDCHMESGPKKNTKPYTVRSELCEY